MLCRGAARPRSVLRRRVGRRPSGAGTGLREDGGGRVQASAVHGEQVEAFAVSHGHRRSLPAYAPELNPTEGVWSHLKRSHGNCAATGIDQLVTLVKTRLKRIQHRPELLDGFLGQTGLVLQPDPP
jgi:transposase